MGSTGSGRISDYPGSSEGTGDSSPDGNGGGPPEDRCARAFETSLEDVEQSDYYQAHGAPPAKGEELEIKWAKRLIAVTATGESVGNLPTAFNYLAACIKEGWQYSGLVTQSASTPPAATVLADFGAMPPE